MSTHPASVVSVANTWNGELVFDMFDKFNNPYSYKPFLMWHTRNEVPAGEQGTAYSDRLYRQNSTKYNELCEKHFGDQGQYFDRRDPSKIEAFLKDYWNYPHLVLVSITEHCNQATGFPLWQFNFIRDSTEA